MYLKENQLIEILSKSDVYLQLNNEIEGFGIAMYEAMALGCIPIAPNILINREILINKFNGFLFEKNSICSTIDELLRLNKQKISFLSSKAISSVKPFNIKNYIEKIKRLIN